jgi:hypothetical protein
MALSTEIMILALAGETDCPSKDGCDLKDRFLAYPG